MSTESLDQLFTLLYLAGGVYCLYIGLRILVKKDLFQNPVLLPNEKNVRDCLDQEAYLKIMKPLFLVFGLYISVTAVYALVDAKLGLTAALFPDHILLATLMTVTILPLLGLIVFAVILRKAQNKYFQP